MPSTNQDILDAMESVAREASVDLLHQEGMENLAIVSAAISLKRIADVLDQHDNATLTNLIQHLAWEAGRSFQQGTRTDR